MESALPDVVRFGREICGDLASAERREWWLANGRGAYAAGTVAGTLTRRYHGLLIAPVNPPLGRHLRTCVRTGNFCSYTSDPEHPVAWQL